MRDKRFIYFLDHSNFMKKIFVLKIVALFVIVLSTAFFVGCEGIDLTPPTDEELPIENWTVESVNYSINGNSLVVIINNIQYIDFYKYYIDYDLTEEVDFSDFININGKTLTYSEVLHSTGVHSIQEQIRFSNINPPLDPVIDVGIEAIFDTQTFFYKNRSYIGTEYDKFPDAKCRFTTDKMVITFY